VATIVLPTAGGDVIRFRKGATPEAQKDLRICLDIDSEIMKPIKTRSPRKIVVIVDSG